MMLVVFEVTPRPGLAQAYLDEAAALQKLLPQQPGWLSVERFQSLSRPGTYLSLSAWRDAAAVTQWRMQSQHRQAQTLGRTQLFADHRLRVAEVVRDYGLHDRRQAPDDVDPAASHPYR